MLYNETNYNPSADIRAGYSDKGFGEYLKNPNPAFSLDLSNTTLLYDIAKMIELKNKMSPSYGKHYSSLLHHLKSIEQNFNCVLMPVHITDVFWANFVPYLMSKGLALSTIKTSCSQLKTAIEWAGKHNAKISDTYDMFRTPSYAHQQVALTPDEISHIYHFDISSIGRRSQCRRNFKRVKDMFVLSCNLGQRFSDMVRVDKSCFNRNIFTILQQKTGTMARVDIERMSIDKNTTYRILEEYGYEAPIQGDISAYDRYVKQLLQFIGCEFLEEVKRETKVNGYIETKMIPKFKLISSHTCRRSFVTNNVLRGFDPLEIMRASGHKTYSSFEKYLCYFDN